MKTAASVSGRDALLSFTAAALAAFIAVGLFSAIAYLFQRDGRPLERLAAAERACAHLSYQSERQACMTARLAAMQAGSVARR